MTDDPARDTARDTARDAARDAALDRHLLRGAFALPVFGVLLVVGTLTHQPDHTSDFAAYADYVTTPWFLAGHLLASIVGAALGIVGTASVAGLVALRSGRSGRVLLGAAISVLGHVLNTAVYGVAAFAQPAIGRAYADDPAAAVAWNGDVYGPALLITAAAALLSWTVGAVLVGTAVRRSAPSLRGVGLAYAVTLPVFYVSGLPGGPVQPVVGALFTVAAVGLVRRLPRAAASPSPAPAAVRERVPGAGMALRR
jgi:hypothetical protein